MAQKLEFVGTIQFWPNGVRGNPVALYMEKTENGECRISVRLPAWRHVVGIGATVNKAAGNYELNLKTAAPDEGAYDGPDWNAGIKAEKPAPPKPVTTSPTVPPAPSAPGGGPADAPPAPTGAPLASTPPSA